MAFKERESDSDNVSEYSSDCTTSKPTITSTSDFDIDEMPDVPGDLVERGRPTSSESQIKFDVESIRVGSASSIGSESRSTNFLSDENDDDEMDDDGVLRSRKANTICTGVSRWDSNVSTITGVRPYQKAGALVKCKSATFKPIREFGRVDSGRMTKRRAPVPPPQRVEEEVFDNRPIVHESPFNLQPVRVLGCKGKGQGAFIRPPKAGINVLFIFIG